MTRKSSARILQEPDLSFLFSEFLNFFSAPEKGFSFTHSTEFT